MSFYRSIHPILLYLPTRILKNCIYCLLKLNHKIHALRIFSTLNDRGKPLSDTDIFKASFINSIQIKEERKNLLVVGKH